MANLKLALLYDNSEVAVELKPEVLKQFLIEKGLKGEELYNELLEMLNREFRNK